MESERIYPPGDDEGAILGEVAKFEEHLQVLIRVRPIQNEEERVEEGETRGNYLSISENQKSIKLSGLPAKSKGSCEMTYDTIFNDNSTQNQVYSKVSNYVTSVIGGFNCTIFAYGQTGTGM
jgi:hypothetical protein